MEILSSITQDIPVKIIKKSKPSSVVAPATVVTQSGKSLPGAVAMIPKPLPSTENEEMKTEKPEGTENEEQTKKEVF